MVNIFEMAKQSKDRMLSNIRYMCGEQKDTQTPRINKGGYAPDAETAAISSAYKDGGKVDGKAPMKRLDKPSRKKSDGGVASSPVEDAKQVISTEAERKKRLAGIGAMKKGGKVCKADGGEVEGPSEDDRLGLNQKLRQIKAERDAKSGEKDPTRGSKYAGEADYKRGGKVKHDDEVQDKKLIKKMIAAEDKKEAFKRGGAVKGKTNINIVIAPSGGGDKLGAPMLPPAPMMVPPMPVPPVGAGALPMPLPMRKDGGCVNKNAGAGGGLGRLEKLGKK